MNPYAILISIAVALLFVLANSLAMKSLESGREWVVWVSGSVGFVAFIGFRYVCKQYGLAIASGIVDSSLTIITILVGIFFFQETLSVRQYLGLAMIVGGILLIR